MKSPFLSVLVFLLIYSFFAINRSSRSVSQATAYSIIGPPLCLTVVVSDLKSALV